MPVHGALGIASSTRLGNVVRLTPSGRGRDVRLGEAKALHVPWADVGWLMGGWWVAVGGWWVGGWAGGTWVAGRWVDSPKPLAMNYISHT